MNEQLKGFLGLIIKTVNDAKEALSDGFQITDVFTLLPDLMGIPKQVENWPQVLEGLKNLNDESRNEIREFIYSGLEGTEKLKQIASRAADFAISGYLLEEAITVKAAA